MRSAGEAATGTRRAGPASPPGCCPRSHAGKYGGRQSGGKGLPSCCQIALGGRVAGPTIYDVATAAGVATSTVSRAFSRPGRVAADTRERVLAVAAELGYRPNPHARALLSGRHHTVAMVVSDITNPHYFELIRGAELRARVSEYTLVLVNAEESPRVEWDQIQRLVGAVDGLRAGRQPPARREPGADLGPAPARPHEPGAARSGQCGARPRRGVPADRRLTWPHWATASSSTWPARPTPGWRGPGGPP